MAAIHTKSTSATVTAQKDEMLSYLLDQRERRESGFLEDDDVHSTTSSSALKPTPASTATTTMNAAMAISNNMNVSRRRDSYDSGLSVSPLSTPQFQLEIDDDNDNLKAEQQKRLEEYRELTDSFDLTGMSLKSTQVSTPLDTTPLNAGENEASPRRKKKKKRLCDSLSVSHFTDVYRMTDDTLGEGSYGRVMTCINKFTNQECAVKIVSKENWHYSRQKILKEIELYHLCQGQKEIIQLLEYFEEPDCFYLVFEKAHGGPLLKQIQDRVHFTEKESAAIIRDLAKALAFLHGRGIAHRDLKPENVLCGGSSKDGGSFLPIKLCDFDLCSAVHQTITTPKLQSPVGSVEYMAPEVVEAFAYDLDFCMDQDYDDDVDDDDYNFELTYDKRCDLWSLGIIAYTLLCGYLPFGGNCGEDCGWDDRGEECMECQSRLFQSIKSGALIFPDQPWAGVSAEAKDLISKLLVRDASRRLDASLILNHPWIVHGGECGNQQQQQQCALETPNKIREPANRPQVFSSDFTASMMAFKRNLGSDMNLPVNIPKPAVAQRVMRRSETFAADLQLQLSDLVHQPSDAKAAFSPFGKTSNNNNDKNDNQLRHPIKSMKRQTSLVVFPEDLCGHCREF